MRSLVGNDIFHESLLVTCAISGFVGTVVTVIQNGLQRILQWWNIEKLAGHVPLRSFSFVYQAILCRQGKQIGIAIVRAGFVQEATSGVWREKIRDATRSTIFELRRRIALPGIVSELQI